MPQTPSQSEPGRARGLAKLTGVEAAHEELALYLRSLKERLGMQSRDLAAALTAMAPTDPVSEFQLSRCLGGKQIPKLSLISRMHQLLAQRTGGDLDESGLKAGRVLMFAAARATGPLQDRAVKLEAALEDVGAQRVETAKELSQLREGLKEEQRRLQGLQQELRRREGRSDHERQRMSEEQEETRRRIAALEDLVRQHEALLRLMREEEGHVKAMVTATGKEVELWQKRLPAPVGQAGASGDIRAAAQTAGATIALRERGNDAAADELLVRYVKEASPNELVALSWEYYSRGRQLEGDRLRHAIATSRPAVELLSLGNLGPISFSSSRERTHVYGPEELLRTAGAHMPISELVLLMKLIKEAGRSSRGVKCSAANRPRAEVRQLLELGLLTRDDVKRWKTSRFP
ncbi:hypothetical protein OG592_42370 (plasmid) [Streptomyces avidinii]|uniref:hypothetical protein n=1 Tax=Streptomyces avidinii TaxID=1895 RepID=UPI002F908B8B|nr:hypothetical protein OG592_42370 [Streptomyces avidinii]